MASKPCPECEGTQRKQEPGEYALLGLKAGRLQIDPNTSNHTAVVVRATVCQGCGYVALYEAT